VLFDTNSYIKARSFPFTAGIVTYSPDGTRIATAEGQRGARVWDAALPGKPIPSGSGNAGVPDGKRRAGLVSDLREMETPLHVLQAPGGDPSAQVLWTEFSPDGRRLLTTHKNGHVKVWSTSSWSLEADFASTPSEVRAAAFAPDGNSLVIGDADGVLHDWSLPRRAEVKTLRTTLGAVTAVAFSPDGKTLVTSHSRPAGTVRPADGRHATGQGRSASGMTYGVMIWNTGTWLAVTRQGFGAAAFSSDGKILALGGENVELIDPESLRPMRTVELPSVTQGEVLSPSMKDADRKIPVSVVALAFSPDGGTLAAGCWDGTVRLVRMTPAR
jgi:WD40 repeat protein